MKNVTIALDDETHRLARIKAAEMGTSLSALVKAYLSGLTSGDAPELAGVRETPSTYVPPAKLPPRKFGQMKGEIWMADDFDTWPDDIQKIFDEMLDGALEGQTKKQP
jgi:hypothetical protein